MNLDDDLRDAQKLLISISHKWYGIGLELKVKPTVLNRIRPQYSDPAECLREMLSEWLTEVDPYPTWEALAQALESCTVKESRLAMEVSEIFLELSLLHTIHTAPCMMHDKFDNSYLHDDIYPVSQL